MASTSPGDGSAHAGAATALGGLGEIGRDVRYHSGWGRHCPGSERRLSEAPEQPGATGIDPFARYPISRQLRSWNIPRAARLRARSRDRERSCWCPARLPRHERGRMGAVHGLPPYEGAARPAPGRSRALDELAPGQIEPTGANDAPARSSRARVLPPPFRQGRSADRIAIPPRADFGFARSYANRERRPARCVQSTP
jgi:hypothetical protein